jgi:hypothetical protein
MAVGDRKTLVTQEFVDSTYDKKTDSTDDLNTYDSGKRATAKSVALLNDRIDEVETTIAGLSGGGGGGSYTLPVATNTILGGIKVGAGLTITDGVLSATAQSQSNGITQIRTKHVSTFGQTTFLATYITGYIDVFLNGIKLDESEFTADNGTDVVLTSGCLAGDNIQIISYGLGGSGSGGFGSDYQTLIQVNNIIQTTIGTVAEFEASLI